MGNRATSSPALANAAKLLAGTGAGVGSPDVITDRRSRQRAFLLFSSLLKEKTFGNESGEGHSSKTGEEFGPKRTVVRDQRMLFSYIKSVSKVLGQLSDSRTSYLASGTISASANNFLS